MQPLVERDNIDINIKDTGGRTPFSYAGQNGHKAVVRLLDNLHDMMCD